MHNETSGVTPGTEASPGDPHGAKGADARPFLYVVRGEPTDAELAAVVTVLAARTAAASARCADTGACGSFLLVRQIATDAGEYVAGPRRLAAERPAALVRAMHPRRAPTAGAQASRAASRPPCRTRCRAARRARRTPCRRPASCHTAWPARMPAPCQLECPRLTHRHPAQPGERAVGELAVPPAAANTGEQGVRDLQPDQRGCDKLDSRRSKPPRRDARPERRRRTSADATRSTTTIASTTGTPVLDHQIRRACHPASSSVRPSTRPPRPASRACC